MVEAMASNLIAMASDLEGLPGFAGVLNMFISSQCQGAMLDSKARTHSQFAALELNTVLKVILQQAC